MHYLITTHAVEQYRDRVIACPERTRADDVLKEAIRHQLAYRRPEVINGAVVVCFGPLRPKRVSRSGVVVRWSIRHVTHMFVVDGGCVVTTLGFMMRPKSETVMRKRRQRSALYRQRAAALPRAKPPWET